MKDGTAICNVKHQTCGNCTNRIKVGAVVFLRDIGVDGEKLQIVYCTELCRENDLRYEFASLNDPRDSAFEPDGELREL